MRMNLTVRLKLSKGMLCVSVCNVVVVTRKQGDILKRIVRRNMRQFGKCCFLRGLIHYCRWGIVFCLRFILLEAIRRYILKRER